MFKHILKQFNQPTKTEWSIRNLAGIFRGEQYNSEIRCFSKARLYFCLSKMLSSCLITLVTTDHVLQNHLTLFSSKVLLSSSYHIPIGQRDKHYTRPAALGEGRARILNAFFNNDVELVGRENETSKPSNDGRQRHRPRERAR